MPTLKPPTKLLVIAQSARMLAQLAVDAGWLPLVIDCFLDEDTSALAADAVRVNSLSLNDIQPVVTRLSNKHKFKYIVYGSGFECFTESLAYLQQHYSLLGNTSAVFRQLQDKPAFFQQLAALHIPYPDSVFTPPADSRGWLVKPKQGQGGLGIVRYDPLSVVNAETAYWQRHLQGQAMSITFIASKGKFKVLGYNRQWSVAVDAQPYVFAGIANHAQLSDRNCQRLQHWLQQLVRIYALQGLGSVDFLLVNNNCYLLEINGRIPASAQLYSQRVFTEHFLACLGHLDTSTDVQAQPAAYEIIYAQHPVSIAPEISWPEWAHDRPAASAIIGKGQPICSIISRGNQPKQVVEQLRQRRQVIENILYTGSYTHAIPGQR